MDMNNTNLDVDIRRVLIKISEILALMKDGKVIIAYEKLSGVQKILNQIGYDLQNAKNDENKSNI